MISETFTKQSKCKTSAEKQESALEKGLMAEAAEYMLHTHELAHALPKLVILDRLVAGGRIDRPTKQRLEIAYQEALTNSIEHGNLELKSEWKEEVDESGVDKFCRLRRERLENPHYGSRRIWLSTSLIGDVFHIRIRDEGSGFIPGNIVQPASRQDDAQTFGRGLTLIVENMDSVFFNAQGNEITMIKRISHGA